MSFADTQAPFLGDPKTEAKQTQEQVKGCRESDRQKRTDQEREQKPFPQRLEIDFAAHGDQAAADSMT